LEEEFRLSRESSASSKMSGQQGENPSEVKDGKREDDDEEEDDEGEEESEEEEGEAEESIASSKA